MREQLHFFLCRVPFNYSDQSPLERACMCQGHNFVFTVKPLQEHGDFKVPLII